MVTCVRCGLPADAHPVGSYVRDDGVETYCPSHAAPADPVLLALTEWLGR